VNFVNDYKGRRDRRQSTRLSLRLLPRPLQLRKYGLRLTTVAATIAANIVTAFANVSKTTKTILVSNNVKRRRKLNTFSADIHGSRNSTKSKVTTNLKLHALSIGTMVDDLG